MKNLEKIGGFVNEDNDPFEIYKGKQRDNFYISSSKLGWQQYKLIILSKDMFTAIGADSYSVVFTDNELKQIAKEMEDYLMESKLIK